MLTKSLMNELSLFKGQEFKPVQRKALVIMCAEYRKGHDGPNKMKNPSKELLENERKSYLTMLERIGFKDEEITKYEDPKSEQLTNYLRVVGRRAKELENVDVDQYGRKGLQLLLFYIGHGVMIESALLGITTHCVLTKDPYEPSIKKNINPYPIERKLKSIALNAKFLQINAVLSCCREKFKLFDKPAIQKLET